MAKITLAQIKELLIRGEHGDITREALQAFMDLSGKPNLEALSETFQVQVEGRTVTCSWIPANYFTGPPTKQEVMDEIARRHLRCPSKEVAIAAFDAMKSEMAAHHSAAIDGVVQTDTDGNQVIGCVSEDKNGRRCRQNYLRNGWYRYYRFLVVVSE